MCVCVLQRTRESWQIVFFIAAAVYAVGGIIFLVFSSGTIQPWAIGKAKSMELVVNDEQVADSVELHV